MGFDLGALLRGGGAGMAGYTEGQNERKKREEEARRAALSEALMNAQFKNYESLGQDRIADNERLRTGDAAAQEAARVAAANARSEADHYRQMFPQLASLPDPVAITQGTQLENQQQLLRRDQARPRTQSGTPDTRSTITLQQSLNDVNGDEVWANSIYDKFDRDPTYEEKLTEARRRLTLTNDPGSAPPPAPRFNIGGFGGLAYPGGANYPARPGAAVAASTPPATTQSTANLLPVTRREYDAVAQEKGSAYASKYFVVR